MGSPTIFCDECGAANKAEDAMCSFCGQSLPNYLLHGRYRILEVVGQGGMGTIYKAEDIRLGQRLVAVKEMIMQGLQNQEEIDEASRAFEQEALLLAKLSHPYLPSIYDHFASNGRWYLVMEYITGMTLSQYLRNTPSQRLPLEDALGVGLKLCTVLGYLHAQTPPIVFGDLKPDNIMLTAEEDLYLIDFGIARLFQATLANEQKFVTPGYSAPEQYQSARISPRADIYSLGATLHQILSGELPENKTVSHFAPLQLGHQLWAKDFETLIMSMLEQDEQKRPQDVKLVKQVLQGIVERQARRPQRDPLRIPLSSDSLSLPHLITYQDIRLSLTLLEDLAWSPDGSHFASANRHGEVYIYAWPPGEKLVTFENETLIPLHTWSFSEEMFSLSKKKRSVWPLGRDGLSLSKERRSVEDPNNVLPAVIVWSPDSTRLAIAVLNVICILNISSKDTSAVYFKHSKNISRIAWSPNGRFIAIGDYDNIVQVLEANTGKKIHEHQTRSGSVRAIAWSLDNLYLAFASGSRASNIMTTVAVPVHAPTNFHEGAPIVQVCEAITGHEVCTYYDHTDNVNDILWSSDGTYIVSCSGDHTIHVWDANTALKLHSLEGHTQEIKYIAFMDNSHLLVSIASNGDAYIWRTDTWIQVESFKTADIKSWNHRFLAALHPTAALMATSTHSPNVIRIWEFDFALLRDGIGKATGIQYRNAKVVLVGDRGVGKSGLGLVLSGQDFVATESTHGRVVWPFPFDSTRDRLVDGRKEIHETLLWDLAGQPGYRLIHQLHLSEVAVALVVFDAHSETDPFAGISHWVRALHTAQRIKGNAAVMKKLLVMARIDRGGKRVSRSRIDELIQALGFDGYFETSAKEGTNIAELANAIAHAIDWKRLSKGTSTELFQRIKTFLITEKQDGRLLSTTEDLHRIFLRTWIPWGEDQDFSAEFATNIGLLEARDLIRQLGFGKLVLLQPELLDTYASALVNAARDEPDGLGNILEEDVLAGKFFIPNDERLKDREQEKLLLIAMVEDLLTYEIVLREQGTEGPYLVFPSESTRENPTLPDPENASVVFTFEGPIHNIYATLAVRLSHSDLFTKKELWKNAVTYTAKVGGMCGMWLKMIEDGQGELTLFFDAYASEETSFNFEEYVQVHLQRKALSDSVKRRRIFRCGSCGLPASDQLVRMRTERGFNWYNCPGCDTRVRLVDREERLRTASPSRVSEMDRAADIQRAQAKAQTRVQGKQETRDFDVFLCYNNKDKDAIIEIGERLKKQGLLPWLDEWELQPGLPWQRVLEQQIEQIKSAAVFIGKDGIGPWQQEELAAFLREFVRRKCPVIPVLLPNAPRRPRLPVFLKSFTWVDFRQQDPNPMRQLIWGITGVRGEFYGPIYQ